MLFVTVQVLQTISTTLQNRYWNLSPRACIEPNGFNRTFWEGNVYSGVGCNCSFNNNTVCHVTHIEMQGLNLTGTLPPEFARLTHLQELDLSRNYLNGSIPAAFGQLRVTILSLLGNRLGGTIPEEIGNITTLEELVLDSNLLEGNLPANLGSVTNLRRLLLSANNFNGTIPVRYSNLRNLTTFRIDGSRISGRIPDFIGNWTSLTRLDMQGTSMEGPIPTTISLLRNLTELRISDLRGPSTNFPNLENMTGLQVLILRNCSIVGTIPPYLGAVSALRNLELTFNMLSGGIPDSFRPMTLNFMLLSHNSLTGEIPNWVLDSGRNVDLSYNNFTQSRQAGCQTSNINLAASHSASVGNSISWCLRPDLPCPRNANYHTLFINCGGGRITYEGNEYEENLSGEGPSHFESHDRWAYSSTGTYMGRQSGSIFTTTNHTSIVSSGAEIYSTARLSPSSLKFYGLCLRSGRSYRVRLHFAEIMYTNDSTFSSLGRRMFDVAIQGRVVLTDFDITREANGVGRGIFRDFDVLVNGTTLEIHLYWTGKGTTAIPDRGVYGPLISAIAITPNFDVSTGGLSVGAIVGIVISSFVVLVLLILLVLWLGGCIFRKDLEDKELRGALELQTGYFTLRQIKAATNNFDIANKIGEGGFGPVYKGVLSDGVVIAVKQLSAKSKQGNREFVNEIGMISALQHPNLVKLFGCCIEGNQLLLIYEYLENNSLARALFGKYIFYKIPKEEFVYLLDWAYVLQEQGNLLDLVDPILGSNYSKKEAMRMLNVALLCANPSPTLRPSMSAVVSMLDGKIPVQAPLVKRDGMTNEDIRFRAFETLSQDSQTRVSSSTFSQDTAREQRGVSMDGPWVDSSVSLSSKEETRDHGPESKLLPDLI
ncbi:hypothetical protein BUALT_Bualt03G0150200 [Buddleja alternifolia]|uniref:non-specific serine/threonine protein kinase n=1 Tax=Buddleja alternifolia TaxID=168488 RepID=A0AAV6Y1Z0_9LAMI|nr:hypothetical protein BUALT_Bualt03G0150200 [Buddleja alternifolia]